VREINTNTVSTTDLDDPGYPVSYETTTNRGLDIGLPTYYAAIKFFANRSTTGKGYSTQLAFSFKNQEMDGIYNGYIPKFWKILYRSAYDGEWGKWTPIDTTAGYTLKNKDINQTNGKMFDSITYYFPTKGSGGINTPIMPSNLNDDGLAWNRFHAAGSTHGFQFFANWNHGGMWFRHHNGGWGNWRQFMLGDGHNYNRLMVDGNNTPISLNQPTVSLAVGDHTTGLNRGGSGIFGVVCSGKNVLRFDAQSVIVQPEASKVYGSATVRNTVIATLDPSGGNDGDIWLKYV